MNGCLCKYPECVGCYIQRQICCIRDEAVMCKPRCCFEQQDPTVCCLLGKGSSRCMRDDCVCCKDVSQCCCLDSRSVCPCCNDDVPCLIAVLGWVICYNNQCACACCPTPGSLKQRYAPPPVQQVVVIQQVFQAPGLQTAAPQPMPVGGYTSTDAPAYYAQPTSASAQPAMPGAYSNASAPPPPYKG